MERSRLEIEPPLERRQAALAVLLGGVLLFALVAALVEIGATARLDDAGVLALRDAADPAEARGPWWLEVAMRDWTALGGRSVLLLVTSAAAGWLLIERRPGAALLLLAAVAGGVALAALLKALFDRPRPDLAAHLVAVRSPSFPSGHATQAAAAWLTLGAILARTRRRAEAKAFLLALAVGVTLLVGLSRVYLGVHYPSDVLAGWCAGAAWAALCWLAALALQRRGRVAPPGERGPE